MDYYRFWSLLGLGAILTLSSGLAARPVNGASLLANTKEQVASKEQVQDPCSRLKDIPLSSHEEGDRLESKRIDLSYYRNADEIVKLVNALLVNEKGCAKHLIENEIPPLGQVSREQLSVGRGGGNAILLQGTKDYIDRAYRLIAPLDLRLPGIDLQLWGVQISSEKPEKLAEVMVDVRGDISLTQQLVRNTFDILQLEALRTLAKEALVLEPGQQPRPLPTLDEHGFLEIAKSIGYEHALANPRRLSLLDIFLVAKAVKDPEQYYQNLYASIVDGEIVDGRFQSFDARYQPYFDAMREVDRPPFERTFRARGLKPKCKLESSDDSKCEIWSWIPVDFDEDESVNSPADFDSINAVKRLNNTDRQTTLEFAFQFANFLSNPNGFAPAELQRTADNLNSELQSVSNAFQRDIEELFVGPTLTRIQDRVAQTKSVTFAQVGRTTISTLSGVETSVKSRSRSLVEVAPEPRSLNMILAEAETLSDQIDEFIPDEETEDASQTENDPSTNTDGSLEGSLSLSRIIGLTIALTNQNLVPVIVDTGTNLTFTPGVLRDLNSAELNINLTVRDPSFTSTGSNNDEISRVGEQIVNTTVYTQALDFFDLSTFTNQALLDGGRAYFPIVGELWRAIFGNIPIFGELFSFSRGPQIVLHESLLLTNSFITPTALGTGLRYPIEDPAMYHPDNLPCMKRKLSEYLRALNVEANPIPPSSSP